MRSDPCNLRVLLISPQYPPILGGAELQAQQLARELDSRGARVSVLTRPCADLDGEEVDRGIRIIRKLNAVPLGPLWGLSFMANTHRWVRRLGTEWDVVHNQQVGLHSPASVTAATALNKASILRFACSGSGGDLANLRRHRFGSTLVSSLQHAGRFIALTAGGAAEIAQYGLPAERIHQIPNGVDLDRFRPQPWPQISEKEPLRVLFVGRVDRQKGLDVLVDALTLSGRADAFLVRIVGDGRELNAVRARAHEARVNQMLEFRGARPDVRPELAWCELLVLPSRYEGMPNVALEAMACGRPVLGTRIDGTADVVTSESGWLVKPEDPAALAEALEALRARREILEFAGLAGRRLVEARFSNKQVATSYMEEYEAALKERIGGS